MVETRQQSASNEENQRSPEPLEDGEVLLTSNIHQSEETIAEALKLVNSGATTLGFTAEDIKAFLRQRFAEIQQPSEQKPSTILHPAVLDPSLSKTTENSTFVAIPCTYRTVLVIQFTDLVLSANSLLVNSTLI